MSENCPDLCTAAKCAELEAKINELEAKLLFHLIQDIPEAHDFNSSITVDTNIVDGELFTAVSINNTTDSSSVLLPENLRDDDEQPPIFDITVGISTSGELEISAQLDEAIVYASTELPRYPVAVDTFETTGGTTLVVQVGEERAETDLPTPSSTAQEIDVAVNYFDDGTLIVYVAYGESFDRDEVDIGRRTINRPGGGGSEDDMSCENLSQELTDCCAQILSAVATNLQKIQELEQYVTIDVSGTVCSEYSCEFPTDDDEQLLLDYAEASFVETRFEGKGIAGLNERLKIIAKNQDAMYKDICKAIDPVRSITRQDLYQFCGYGGVDRADFDNTPEGTELYQQAVKAYVAELINQSKYGYLFDGGDPSSSNSVLLSAPSSYINEIKSDFALIQARDNNQTLCNIGDAPDVVSIVASDNVLDRHQGKTLVLHLVTFDNYPKRQRNSSYWQQQIPEPLGSYVWEDNFKSLVWNRGNLYCELYFEDIKDPVSGWFFDKDAADSWFNSILELTNATERNRKYHEQKTPRRNITPNLVRPYRAFITSISDTGQAICEIKYVPPIENE